MSYLQYGKKNKTTTATDYKCDMILPTELASILINNDWSVLDYIDDAEYTKCVEQFIEQTLTYDGLTCIDVLDDSSFSKYHDMLDYGVLACDCSTFIFN